MTSLAEETAFIIMVLVAMPTYGMELDKKYFQVHKFAPMDDLIPPIKPIRDVDSKLACAIMCLRDVTCAAFSYGVFLKMCSHSREVIRPYDVSISLPSDGFAHYITREDIGNGLLPPGYRTFDINKLALRFHYYRPKNWKEARDLCSNEGSRLLTLDDNTRLLLKRLFKDNKELSTTDGLYVGGSFIGPDFLWQNGSPLLAADPLWANSGPTGTGNCTFLSRKHGFKLVDFNCTQEQPYVCEYIKFESSNKISGISKASLVASGK